MFCVILYKNTRIKDENYENKKSYKVLYVLLFKYLFK